MSRRLLLAITALAVVPASAHAAPSTVGLKRAVFPDDIRFNRVVLTGSADANHVIVSRAGRDFVFSDNAGITAQAGCRQVSATQAACRTFWRASVLDLTLGDGDDTLHFGSAPLLGPDTKRYRRDKRDPISEIWLHVFAGAGNDTLTAPASRTDVTVLAGEAGDDTLSGGPRAEELYGGAGSDTIAGGAGDDRVGGDLTVTSTGNDDVDYVQPVADVAPDKLDGGAGSDTVTYMLRSLETTVDLAAGSGGAAGENDSLTGVENVEGGMRRNVLRGDDRANRLTGAAGIADELEGRGGNDALLGTPYSIDTGKAEDLLVGGDGNDSLRFPGPQSTCGAGVDEIRTRWNEEQIVPPPDCERAREYAGGYLGSATLIELQTARLAASTVRLRVTPLKRRAAWLQLDVFSGSGPEDGKLVARGAPTRTTGATSQVSASVRPGREVRSGEVYTVVVSYSRSRRFPDASTDENRARVLVR